MDLESLSQRPLGETLFRYRDYTPVPLILLVLLFQKPTISTVAMGLILIFFGELIRLYSVSFIGGISRTRKGSLGGKLVTGGSFGWVRNPLYVGNFFILLGFGVFGGKLWLTIVSVMVFVFQYRAIVEYEENLLVARFGEEFEAYRNTVPAWIPRSIPPLAEWEWPEHGFSDAIRNERSTLMNISILIALLLFFATT